MTNDDIEPIAKLEILFAEQEYLVQTLNTIVSRQDREITQLKADMQMLKQQYIEMKDQLPGQSGGLEKPPHY